MAEHGDDPAYSYRGAESFDEMIDRVERVQEWLLASGDEVVLAVTHGIFLRFFFFCVLLGDRFEASMTERLWQLRSVNCGLSTFGAPEPSAAPRGAGSLALPDLDGET
jgi:broad specificity phosphatase PhoE